VLLATSEAELQELVGRLDRVSRKYSLLINVDKTKVMASDGIACPVADPGFFCKGGAAAGAFGVPQAPSCPISLRPLRKFRGS